jgi:HD-like signal output (HDOD) protein
VAAIAAELARLSQLPRHLEPFLERVAILHCSKDFGGHALARLAADIVAFDSPTKTFPQSNDAADLDATLSLLEGRPASSTGHSRQCAAILRLCFALDAKLSSQAFEFQPFDTILAELQDFAGLEGFGSDLVSHLHRLHSDSLGLSSKWASLPIQATVAQRVIRCLGSAEECQVSDLEKLAAGDPVMAGALIKVANSPRYSPVCRISKIREAISYIGTVTARKVLLAVAVRPLFASGGLRRLWTHSLEMAQLCSSLSAQSGILGPEEGLLIGLVHDVGSLAVQTLPGAILERYNRLVENGCPRAYVEQVLFRQDHGEIGAAILAQWNFPASAIEAVRFHHQPERSESPVASLVYLAEFWCGQEEDLPSYVRIRECAARTGISLESLATAHLREDGLKILRSVA